MIATDETQSAIEALALAYHNTDETTLKATLTALINHQWTRAAAYDDFVAELRKPAVESRVYNMRHMGPRRFEMLRKLFLVERN